MIKWFIDWLSSLTESEKWVISFFVTAFIILIGHWFGQRLNHRLTIIRERKTRVKSASIEFRSAFMDELSILNSKINTNLQTRKLLLDAFEKHNKAFIVFRQHVPLLKRRSFNKVWNKYYYGQKFDPSKWNFKNSDSIFLEYVTVNDEEETIARNLAIKNIHALLAFAK